MHVVRRNNAILLCGGIGRRMSPIPRCNKALLPIYGEINIKRIIKILYNKGIEDIIIATNPESSMSLLNIRTEMTALHPSLNISVVPAYDYVDGCNNVVTMRAVSEFIRDTYIIECDQYYTESRLNFLSAIPYSQSYLFTQQREEIDWGISTDNTGKVLQILHQNPDNTYYCLSGITYFTGSSAQYLREALESCESNVIYWEELLRPSYQTLYEWRCTPEYSTEYDDILDLINNKFISPDQIADLVDENSSAIKLDSMTNTTYRVYREGKPYALRIPGYGTDQFIDHSREKIIENSLPDYIRPNSEYYGRDSVKMSEFLEGYTPLQELDDIPRVLNTLSLVHSSNIDDRNKILFLDLEKEVNSYEEIHKGSDIPVYENYNYIKSRVMSFLRDWFQEHEYQKVHRDLVPSNILLNSAKDVKLIDWEYSGYLHGYWDLASLCCEYCDVYPRRTLDALVNLVVDNYEGALNQRDTIYRWIAVVDFVWAAWSLAKAALGDDVLDYGLRRYQRASNIIDTLYSRGEELSI